MVVRDVSQPVELSIVMPCLDEAETVATCIDKAYGYLRRSQVAGEVVIADNGSTDGSVAVAEAHGARVVPVADRGYGNALMGGIRAARGTYVVMGDADDSYDFSDLDPFLARLRTGDDLVMGNRFKGGIEPGAMPWSHRYVGNPVLSSVGRLFFHAPVGDFHCGLRGFRRQAILDLDLRTTGMEFASEVVVRSCLAGLRISEVPTTLRKDGRSRPPHLRSFRDGWRHLRFLLLYSPRWLFVYPGLVMLLLGLVATVALTVGPVGVGSVTFDVGTLVYTAGLTIVGYQGLLFGILTKRYAANEGFLPPGRPFGRIERWLSLERGLALGVMLVVFGLVAGVLSFFRWRESSFGALDPSQTIRTVIPAMLGLVLGMETLLSSLFLSILGIRRVPPVPAIAATQDSAAAATTR